MSGADRRLAFKKKKRRKHEKLLFGMSGKPTPRLFRRDEVVAVEVVIP